MQLLKMRANLKEMIIMKKTNIKCSLLLLWISFSPMILFGQNIDQSIVFTSSKRIVKNTGFPIYDSSYMTQKQSKSCDTLIIELFLTKRDSIRVRHGYAYVYPNLHSHEKLNTNYKIQENISIYPKCIKYISYTSTIYYFDNENGTNIYRLKYIKKHWRHTNLDV